MSSTFQLEKVEVALSPQERFQEFLQSRGRRMTQQRRQIVDEVFSRHEHFNADELCDHLNRSSGSRVSRPTVYRTLTELEESGLLRKMVLAGRRSVYEHDYGYPQHDHLYCEKCEKLIEFLAAEFVAARTAHARRHGAEGELAPPVGRRPADRGRLEAHGGEVAGDGRHCEDRGPLAEAVVPERADDQQRDKDPEREVEDAPDHLDEDVRQSIARIKASPFIPRKASVRGFVYDVRTGRLNEVSERVGAGAASR